MASTNQTFRRVNGSSKDELSSVRTRTHLTPRESLILADVVEGHSSKEIARALDLSPRTVEFHRANLLRKWGAKNTVHLVRKVLGD